MRRIRRFLAVLLLAVGAMTVAAAIPSFSDLQAAPAEMADHPCECPDGCPPDMSDCGDAQACSVVCASAVAAEPPAAVSLQGVRQARIAVAHTARDSLSRPPPFHPPKR